MIYIDLLPQEKKKELKRKKRFRLILRQGILFLFPLLVLIAIMANVFFLMKMQYSSISASKFAYQGQENYQKLNAYEDAFSKTNDLVTSLSKIQSSHLNWQTLFAQLSSLTSDNVYLTEISTKNYQVFITGKAKTRDDLLDFKNKLTTNQCFQNVNMPLSDLVTKENVDFQMDFLITRGCLLNGK